MPLACGGVNKSGVGEGTGQAITFASSAGKRNTRLARPDQVVGGLLYQAVETQGGAADPPHQEGGVVLIEGDPTATARTRCRSRSDRGQPGNRGRGGGRGGPTRGGNGQSSGD